MKKAIISGIVFSSILLVGCNGNKNEEPVQVLAEQDVVVTSQNGESDANVSPESNLLSELHNEITSSISEQTELGESMAISLGGNSEEISVSVSFPKDVKVDNTMIQQIVEDSIKKVSETENVTISEENITIKIEEY
ncbi:topoisomerase [Sporosarcina sp. 179-K 3D1 HS]|uniref:topoisomerase n=1 Tax=Sporosarcina sp. 179-K 3D1 HS TaxID=3232169 RepID=UPI0039A3128A